MLERGRPGTCLHIAGEGLKGFKGIRSLANVCQASNALTREGSTGRHQVQAAMLERGILERIDSLELSASGGGFKRLKAPKTL